MDVPQIQHWIWNLSFIHSHIPNFSCLFILNPIPNLVLLTPSKLFHWCCQGSTSQSIVDWFNEQSFLFVKNFFWLATQIVDLLSTITLRCNAGFVQQICWTVCWIYSIQLLSALQISCSDVSWRPSDRVAIPPLQTQFAISTLNLAQSAHTCVAHQSRPSPTSCPPLAPTSRLHFFETFFGNVFFTTAVDIMPVTHSLTRIACMRITRLLLSTSSCPFLVLQVCPTSRDLVFLFSYPTSRLQSFVAKF